MSAGEKGGETMPDRSLHGDIEPAEVASPLLKLARGEAVPCSMACFPGLRSAARIT